MAIIVSVFYSKGTVEEDMLASTDVALWRNALVTVRRPQPLIFFVRHRFLVTYGGNGWLSLLSLLFLYVTVDLFQKKNKHFGHSDHLLGYYVLQDTVGPFQLSHLAPVQTRIDPSHPQHRFDSMRDKSLIELEIISLDCFGFIVVKGSSLESPLKCI